MGSLSDNEKKSSINFSTESDDTTKHIGVSTQGANDGSYINYDNVFIDFILHFKGRKGIRVYKERLIQLVKEKKKSLYVDFADLEKFDKDFAYWLLDKAKEALPMLGDSLYRYLSGFEVFNENQAQDEQVIDLAKRIKPYLNDFLSSVDKIYIRLTNIPAVDLRKLDATLQGKLIAVEGTIAKLTQASERLIEGTFIHENCEVGGEFTYPDQGELDIDDRLPALCPLCGKRGTIKLIKEKSKFRKFQRAILEEPEPQTGQLPKQIELILEDDLVDTLRLGDRVRAIGIFELKTNKKGATFSYRLRVVSVEVLQPTFEEVKISEEDEEKIKELAKDPEIIERIISSIAPSIQGRWEIKEAIALALFGGVEETREDGTRRRGNIHVLIIGDPGTAKSQLLQFAAAVAPRGIYTTGKGSTAAGLTATVNRDPQTGEWYAEAGVLPLASGGIAAIDEFEKMRKEDREALHEAMEQQTASVSKAGVIMHFTAKTTIIAAANPKFGKYMPERPLIEQITFDPALLSRFDLIFILRDLPGPEDELIARKVLGLDKKNGIEQYLKQEIDPGLLKKYIAYARKKVFPQLDNEAKKLIMDFYVKMRQAGGNSQDSPIPITPRQLDALVRITQAYARMRLSDIATKEDAQRAINIMRRFLETVGLDVETGQIDIYTIMSGKPASLREKMMRLLEIIDALSNINGCAKLGEILDEAEKLNISREQADRIIRMMRRDGMIREKEPNCYIK